jgi:hypothetical protein
MTPTDQSRHRDYYQATTAAYQERHVAEREDLLNGISGADLLGSVSYVASVATRQNTPTAPV